MSDPAAVLDAAAEEIRISEPLKGTRWGDAMLALAELLNQCARRANNYPPNTIGRSWAHQEAEPALAVARAILGPGWAIQQAARDLAAIEQEGE